MTDPDPGGMTAAPPDAPPPRAASLAPRRASAGFMLRHPSRWIAFAFGSGLSPWAPGTVGTLWAWLAFLALDPWLDDGDWGLLIGASTILGWWACTRTARDLRQPDPSSIVWDEVVAFWAVLWIVMPAGLAMQAAAFALFRLFDAAKPGPVAWADRLFKARRGIPPGWAQGFGIMLDDAVAALCTLLVLALLTWLA